MGHTEKPARSKVLKSRFTAIYIFCSLQGSVLDMFLFRKGEFFVLSVDPVANKKKKKSDQFFDTIISDN